MRVESLGDISSWSTGEIAMLAGRIEACLADDAGYLATQALPGRGPVPAAVFVAEIGDVARFPSARHSVPSERPPSPP
ncbi:MAG: transposase [Acidimicrobiales bacterium]